MKNICKLKATLSDCGKVRESTRIKKLIPKNGVYASYVNVDGQKFKGAVNIGIKPTFEQLTPTVEVHILNFNHDIYDKKIKLELITRIRDEIEFPNLEALKNQIATDILHIQNLLT